MPKPKMVPIRVTAEFRITFIHKVTEAQFIELDKDQLNVEDVVDETIAYGELASGGDCEMTWDYGPPVKQIKPAKPKKAKKK